MHVQRPPSLEESSLHLLPGIFPDMQGVALPETGDQLNISIGVPRHFFDKLPSEITSDDPKVMADYVRTNFKAFDLVD